MSIRKRSTSPAADHDALLHWPKRLRGGGGNGIDERDLDHDLDQEPEFEEDLVEIDEGDDLDDLLMLHTSQDEEHDVNKPSLPDPVTTKWSRPPVAITSNDQDLSFQWLDMDVIGGKPLTQNPNASATHVVGASTSPQVPILRVYGVTMQGNSVAAFLHGFTPYGYFAIPAGCDTSASTRARFRT